MGTEYMSHGINCLLISERQQHRNLTWSCISVNPTLLGWEETPRGSLASQSSQISDVWVHWEIFPFLSPPKTTLSWFHWGESLSSAVSVKAGFLAHTFHSQKPLFNTCTWLENIYKEIAEVHVQNALDLHSFI